MEGVKRTVLLLCLVTCCLASAKADPSQRTPIDTVVVVVGIPNIRDLATADGSVVTRLPLDVFGSDEMLVLFDWDIPSIPSENTTSQLVSEYTDDSMVLSWSVDSGDCNLIGAQIGAEWHVNIASCQQAGSHILRARLTSVDNSLMRAGETSIANHSDVGFHQRRHGDTRPPALHFIPRFASNTPMKAGAVLVFDSTSASAVSIITRFGSSGCTFDSVGHTRDTAYATLISCRGQAAYTVNVAGWANTHTTSDYYISGSATIVYDTVAPTLNPTLSASTKIKANIQLSFTASEAIQASSITFVASPSCSFGMVTLSGTKATTTLSSCSSQGTFTVTITASDVAGNSASRSVSYVYDSVIPTLNPSIAANSKVKPNTPLAFAASEAIQSPPTFAVTGCTLGTPQLSGQTATATLVSCTAQGAFSVTVTVKDLVGNVGTRTLSYIYDSIGPTLTPLLAGNVKVKPNTLLSFTASEPVQAGFTFLAPGCTFNDTILTGQTITANLVSCSTQGAFSLTVTVKDSLSNIGSRMISYVYDSIGPNLTSILPANTTVVGNTDFSFTTVEPVTNITFSAANCTFSSPTLVGQFVTATLSNCTVEGLSSLQVTTFDAVGNAATITLPFVYDSLGPIFTPLLEANSTVKGNTSLSFTTNEPIQSTNMTLTSNCTFEPITLTDQNVTAQFTNCTERGHFLLTITALDIMGNVGTHTVEYIYDSIIPTEGVNATLYNVTLFGDIQFTSNSTSTVTTVTQIDIEGCATFGGDLTIQVPGLQEVIESNQTFIHYRCYDGGRFETITLVDPETLSTCSTDGNYMEQSFSALVKSCNIVAAALASPPPNYTPAIIGGVVGGVALLALVAVLLICFVKPIHDRVFPNRARIVDMDEAMKEAKKEAKEESKKQSKEDKKQNRITLGPDAFTSAVYDDGGRGGENALYEGV